MLFRKRHPLDGKTNTMELDVTEEQFQRWQSGEHIQRVMPQLTAEEREFLISGLLPGEYDALFAEDEVLQNEAEQAGMEINSNLEQ
jgi:hypothetical protein